MEQQSYYLGSDIYEYDNVYTSGDLRAAPSLTYTLSFYNSDPNASPATATFEILASVSTNANFKIADLGIVLNYDPSVVTITGVFLPEWMSADQYASSGDQIYTPSYSDNRIGAVSISCYGDNPQTLDYDPNDGNTPSFPIAAVFVCYSLYEYTM